MIISPASSADIPELEKLINSGYRGESSKKGWTTEADLLDGIRIDAAALAELIGKKDTVILTAYNQGQSISGCVLLEKQTDQLYLAMLTVSPVLQGAGIGQQLLKAAEVHAASIGCDKIVMTVISVRTELVDWYKRKGYADTGKRKPFPMEDPRFGLPKQFLEFVVMEKLV